MVTETRSNIQLRLVDDLQKLLQGGSWDQCIEYFMGVLCQDDSQKPIVSEHLSIVTREKFFEFIARSVIRFVLCSFVKGKLGCGSPNASISKTVDP